MKVGIDLTCITTVFDGGKDQVIYNLLRGFQALGHDREIVVFAYPFLEERVRQMLPGAELKVFPRFRGKKLLQDLPLRTFVLPYHARARRLDVLFFAKRYTGLHRFGIPTVVLPGDVQFKAFPERYPAFSRMQERLLNAMDFRLRDRIVAMSDFDAGEMRRFYPRWSAKVVRIYNPICFGPDAPLDETRPHHRRYLLSINVAYPHKNTLTLLRAFEMIRDRIPHDLVLVGRVAPWNAYLPEFVEQHGLAERVFFTGYVEERRVRNLIDHADLYVNPSLYEGFGMAPIEVMGAGVPVLSSRVTASFETTRGLAEYYEPAQDPAALATKLLGGLNRPPSQAAREHIRQVVRECYDYRLIARVYWELFRKLVDRSMQERSGIS